MEYISIKEAAEKWGVTVRRVQELCKSGEITGAVRFGRAWMIPKGAKKPKDRRCKKEEETKNSEKSKNGFLIPAPRQNPFLVHTDLYSIPGSADSVVRSFSDYPETARLIQAHFDFQRGNFDKIYNEANYFLSTHEAFNVVISAGALLARCAIWRGDINLWRRARQHIYEAPLRCEEDRQIIDFWLAVVDTSVNDSRQFPEWFRRGLFDVLPGDTYCAARMYYVRYMITEAHDVAIGRKSHPDVEGMGLMLTMPYFIEPMISQAKYEKTLIPEIYLHMMAATVYHNLGDDKTASTHIDDAVRLCIPDKLITILAEFYRGLDSLLDARLMAIDIDMYNRVRELYKQMNAGWIKLHNQLMERNISQSLTVREREVAKLAAFGMTNTEIAKRLHLELASVKSYIFSAMNKVGAFKRSELGLHI